MEEKKIIKLDLTDDERAKVSEHARYTKSSTMTNNIIYEKDIIKKLNIIKESYLLFLDLSNNYGINESIKSKLAAYIQQFEEINNETLNFLSEDFDIEYGKDEIIRDINLFFIENNELISNLIYETFLIGRTVKRYNPEETTGYY